MKVLCILVLYKTKLEDSVAYKTLIERLLERNDICLYIYDNSPLESPPSMLNSNVVYVSDPTNPGISKAYNCGARYALKNGYDWLLFTDQDTMYPEIDYVQLCKKALYEHPMISLMVPIVETYNGILSPLRTRHHIPYAFNYRIGDFNLLLNSAIINSGILVRLDFFLKAGGYNENVPLDYSDYQFIERLQTVLSSFYLVNYRIRQSFSSDVDSDEALTRRFKSLKISTKNFEGNCKTKLDLWFILIKRCFSLSYKKKTIKYLKILLFD